MMFSWEDAYRGSPVRQSPDLDRIVALPRRDWRVTAERDAQALTRIYGKGGQTLRPIQAAVLRDLVDIGGAFGPLSVGTGKSLVSFLAPQLLESKRPLLLVPAQLVDKTYRDLEDYRRFWELPDFIRVVSYEFLGRISAAHLLDNYNPDIIIADECHKLRSGSAAVTKRVKKFHKTHPHVPFVLLSGTITKRSIKDYAHLLEWCLGEGSPLPKHWPDLMEWASAIDEIRGDKSTQAPAGALARLMHTPDLNRLYVENPLKGVRQAYQQRLVETPGVIASGAETIGTSLTIRQLTVNLPKHVLDEFAKMRATWETPDGHPFSEAVELWRHSRELATGFFYKWVPRPEESWLQPRKEWARMVRSALSRYSNLDSPLMVAQACMKGQLGHEYIRAYQDWIAVRDTFKPKTEAVWMHDEMIKAIMEWSQKPGLIWCDQVALCRRLEEMGLNYYGRQAVNRNGDPIRDADPKGCHLVSVASGATGHNLQAFSRNLIVSAPPTGRLYEQLLGRTHRSGQLEDEVTVDVAIACPEQRDGFWNAVRDAHFIQESTGSLQKLTFANILVDRD